VGKHKAKKDLYAKQGSKLVSKAREGRENMMQIEKPLCTTLK
jgi:hypothetical protein